MSATKLGELNFQDVPSYPKIGISFKTRARDTFCESFLLKV